MVEAKFGDFLHEKPSITGGIYNRAVAIKFTGRLKTETYTETFMFHHRALQKARRACDFSALSSFA